MIVRRNILIGYLEGTTFTQNNQLGKSISDAFILRGYDAVYLGNSFIKDVLHIPFVEYEICNTEISILSVEEREKWIDRCLKSWTKVAHSKNQAEAIVNAIEINAITVLKHLQPIAFIGWNTMEYRFGIVGDVARKLGIQSFSIETGALFQSLRIDRYNLATQIKFPNIDKKYIQIGNELIKQIVDKNLSLYEQNKYNEDISLIENARKLGKRIVLVLGTLESDVGIFPSECRDSKIILPGFENSYEVAITASLIKTDFVIYKPHPLWKSDFPGSEEDNRNVLTSFTDSILLIDLADIVININGKLIVPLVLKNKLIINIGIGFFSNLEFGFIAFDKDSLIQILSNEFNYDCSKSLANIKFALGFLYSTSWYIFESSDIDIPNECLTINDFVVNILSSLEIDNTVEVRIIDKVIFLNYLAFQSKKIYKDIGNVHTEISLRNAFKTIFSLSKWKNRLRLALK